MIREFCWKMFSNKLLSEEMRNDLLLFGNRTPKMKIIINFQCFSYMKKQFSLRFADNSLQSEQELSEFVRRKNSNNIRALEIWNFCSSSAQIWIPRLKWRQQNCDLFQDCSECIELDMRTLYLSLSSICDPLRASYPWLSLQAFYELLIWSVFHFHLSFRGSQLLYLINCKHESFAFSSEILFWL